MDPFKQTGELLSCAALDTSNQFSIETHYQVAVISFADCIPHRNIATKKRIKLLKIKLLLENVCFKRKRVIVK